MFKQRTITAIVILPLVGLMVWLGGWYFVFFILLILAAAGYEWVRLFRTAGFRPSWGLTITGVIGYLVTGYILNAQTLSVFWIIFLFCNLLYSIAQYEKQINSAPMNFLIQVGGVVYISGLGMYFLLVREWTNGELWFFFFVAITAIGDTGAYLIGQRWGVHKMGHHVSPNKSWEGYVAGVITAALTGLVFSLIAGEWFVLNPGWATLLAGGLYVLIPIGDFGISMFKRWAGVKNTSNLLPGHGGILDRIDTHFWTMALGYHILKLLVFTG